MRWQVTSKRHSRSMWCIGFILIFFRVSLHRLWLGIQSQLQVCKYVQSAAAGYALEWRFGASAPLLDGRIVQTREKRAQIVRSACFRTVFVSFPITYGRYTACCPAPTARTPLLQVLPETFRENGSRRLLCTDFTINGYFAQVNHSSVKSTT